MATAAEHDQPEESGGLGGEVDPANGARDTRMVERAIKGRWPIPPELRDKIPEQLGKIATSKGASHRNRIAAARALLAADALNLEQEKRGEPIPVNLSGTVTLSPGEIIRAGQELETSLRERATLNGHSDRTTAAAGKPSPGKSRA